MAKKHAGKPKRGRPKEGRIRLLAHVLPITKKTIDKMVDRSDSLFNTRGKILDEKFMSRSHSVN